MCEAAFTFPLMIAVDMPHALRDFVLETKRRPLDTHTVFVVGNESAGTAFVNHP